MTHLSSDITHPWSWPLAGGLIGFVGGMLDYLLVRALGVQMMLGEHDVSLGVVLFFAINIGALGALIGWSRSQRLILKQKNAQIEAQQAALLRNERALVEQQSLATIGRLSSGVAHEVRNPLAIIRASASIITEDVSPDERSHEVASFIRDEVDRLDAFVGRLMDYTRRLEPDPRQIKVQTLIERLSHLSQAHPRHVSQKVHIEWPEPSPELLCTADEDLLERQLLTILYNAMEAAHERVVMRLVPGGSELVRVEIADDGPGVDEQDRAHIFEPFFTTKAEGTGLGLAMASKIAKLHGHTLTYEHGQGASGQGACFVLDLCIKDLPT